ncbi:hypothetical protein Tco_1016776 [Tanacetum coccineum]|uniref:Uncharacterized protein n=1 Tax=Tanacetum coccineum TaxID=301880 RepID=A0ABQ5FPQ8_9ASTR
MSESSELSNESYVLYDCVMNSLTAHQERKIRKDRGTRRGRHSTSSSSAFDQPSSSHLNDDGDRNGEGNSRSSTHSPIRFVNSLTNDIPQIRDEHRGGLRSIGKGLRNLWKNMKKPLNPQPLQSHPSLDVTLSLSSITPLDHILDTSSPPLPQPQPQPPLMGHPIYFNYHDYHGSTYLCCFHNRNLIFSLRGEMNLMFAHIEYLLTSIMNSFSPHHP